MSNRLIPRSAVLVLGLVGIFVALADVVARRELTRAADISFARGGSIAQTAEARE